MITTHPRCACIAAPLATILAVTVATQALPAQSPAEPHLLTTQPESLSGLIHDLERDIDVAGEEPEGPWRLQHELDASGAPEWLRISGSFQTRLEAYWGQFRAGGRFRTNDASYMLRTLLKLEAEFDAVNITVEGIDSRQYLGDARTALGTSIVNAVDLLQASITIRFADEESGLPRLTIGRQTMDLGSRRLIARNGYRNTINNFGGARFQYGDQDFSFEAWYFAPVLRTPTSPQSLADNDIRFDREDFDQNFFGISFEGAAFENHRWHAYAMGFVEDVNRDRELATVGARFRLPRAVGEWDYELELVGQIGESRTSASAPKGDHLAALVHAHLGYTFDVAWTPRIRLAFDWASGDDDPNDTDNNRFDGFYGAQLEFGRTSTYLAFRRANIISPELSVEVRPTQDLRWILAWRPAWLDSRRDAWVDARLRDPTGSSGSLVGNQLSLRMKWDIVPQSISMQGGLVYLIRGEFAHDVPGARDNDTVLAWVQLNLYF